MTSGVVVPDRFPAADVNGTLDIHIFAVTVVVVVVMMVVVDVIVAVVVAMVVVVKKLFPSQNE